MATRFQPRKTSRSRTRKPTRAAPRLTLRLTPLLIILAFLFVCNASASAPEYAGPNADGEFIGIHLGATRSRVGVVENSQIRILANADGDGADCVPSYVAASERGLLVGEDARRTGEVNLFQAVLDMKEYFAEDPPRRRGVDMQDYSPYYTPHSKSVSSYAIKDNRPALQIESAQACYSYKPEEVYAPLLAELKGIAEAHIGGNITGAVIASPLPYDESSFEDLQRAGDLVGLPIIRHMRESTGTIMALGLDELSFESDRYVLFYDLSDDFETLTLSVVHIEDGVMETLSKDITMDIIEDMYGGPYRSSNAWPREMGPLSRRTTEGILERASLDAIWFPLTGGGLENSKITDLVFSPSVRDLPSLHARVSDWFENARIANSERLDESPVWGATMMSKWLSEEDTWVPCSCDQTRPAIGIHTNKGFLRVLSPCESVPAYETRRLVASCHRGRTMVKFYALREPPPLDNHLMNNLGNMAVSSMYQMVPLGELDLSTVCNETMTPSIELSVLLSRGSIPKIQAVNTETGQSGMLTFPAWDLKCGHGMGPEALNHTFSTGRDLEAEYRTDLRGFLGPSRDQKPADPLII